MRILLVEDDQNLGSATTEGLKDGYAVDLVISAEEAEEALATTNYHLLILDINLPGISGLELLKKLRKNNNNIPVLLLTARYTVPAKVEGLNSGADDYLVKPFELEELLARCASLIRRSKGTGAPVIKYKSITYEPSTGSVKLNDSDILLTKLERGVFDSLMRNIGRPISKEKITENIYDWSSDAVESNTIEVYISTLRKKFGADFIKTIRGVGYLIPK